MRRLIAGMKLSLDGKVEGADGMADWVEAWSDDYGLLPQIDAVLLGAGMYPGYEQYWTGIRNEPERVAWITGKPPTAAELEYARFASRTSHYVLSKTPTNTAWSNTHFIKSSEEVAAIKQQPGKDIYLAGGARTTASLIDAGLVDELRLIVYPVIAGAGKPLFTGERRRELALREVRALGGGRAWLIYGLT
ncbi:MAG: dihydrofolate reductase family protein [Candidatus Cybelea sp.]|jgi:dihydrofolate reductase